MKPMLLDVEGTSFVLARDLAALSALVREASARPAWQVLRGCERCKVVCTERALCACCSTYGKNFGGGASYYPVDGKRHIALMPIDEFLPRAEQRLARGAA